MLIDTLQFYAFSADKKAGEGCGDIIENIEMYQDLNTIKNWRQMFSSFWSEDPFVYDELTYLSFEHAYQASKYKINGYVDIAYEFCLESKSEISLKTGKDVQKYGRTIKLSNIEINIWDANMRSIKEEIYKCKFTKESTPGKALIETKKAILINAGPRIKKIRCTRLENLRDELQS